MTALLQDRICIVTGAARGLGANFATHFAQLGAKIVGMDLKGCEDTVRRIEDLGGEAVGIAGDVTQAADALAAVETALRHFGRVDVLLNNAALYGGVQIRGFEDIPEDEWDAMMTVNVKGVWQMCRAVTPQLRQNGGGSIINISSNVIFMGKAGFLHYVASKGAVWALTGALSRELAGDNISVNALAPGYTITEATRSMSTADTVAALEEQILDSQSIKRLIEPDDLVGAAAFLASKGAAMVTGQTLSVDGGTITR